MAYIFQATKSFVTNIWESTRLFFCHSKSAEGRSFDDARYMITELIGIEAERFGFWKIVNICQKMKKSVTRRLLH